MVFAMAKNMLIAQVKGQLCAAALVGRVREKANPHEISTPLSLRSYQVTCRVIYDIFGGSSKGPYSKLIRQCKPQYLVEQTLLPLISSILSDPYEHG